MSRPIIVTGAAGFIGRNVIAELNARGATNLILVDKLGSDDKWQNLRGLEFEDLMSPESFITLAEANRAPVPAGVIHLGACSSTTERDADFLLENNFRYTCRLCSWALGHGARFVYASSAATYGDGSQGYSDVAEKLSALRPLNMYGYSKHLFDLWAQRQGLFDRIVGLKYFNVFGPYEDHKGDMRSLVHKAYGQIATRGWIELFKSDRSDYADGAQKRDFIYVRDAVDVTVHFIERRDASGLFNCGTGVARTWLDLARALFVAAGRSPDVRFVEMPPALRGKYQYFTEASTENLRGAGYGRPFTSLEEGVRDYVINYLQSAKAPASAMARLAPSVPP